MLIRILFAKDPVPTPWPVYFSDHIATSEEQLIRIFHNLESSINEIIFLLYYYFRANSMPTSNLE
jgi:hypothetical protein